LKLTIIVRTSQENNLVREVTGFYFSWHDHWIRKISATYLKLILNSKLGTEGEMIVTYFREFNWQTEYTKNLRILGLKCILLQYRSWIETMNVASSQGRRARTRGPYGCLVAAYFRISFTLTLTFRKCGEEGCQKCHSLGAADYLAQALPLVYLTYSFPLTRNASS
jgi:hypothetical protein